MDITLYVKEQPGGRCAMYRAYVEKLVEHAGAHGTEVVDNDKAAAIAINGQVVPASDGVFVSAEDINQVVALNDEVMQLLDEVLEQCLSEWE